LTSEMVKETPFGKETLFGTAKAYNLSEYSIFKGDC